MAAIDWGKALDLGQAVANVKAEFVGDWYHDPWGWPELDFILKKRHDLFHANCGAAGSRQMALIDVPKENWGTRPAVVLDIIDRVTYQALVDRLSVDLIGKMSANAFGWRLPALSPRPGVYSHNSQQWKGYRSHLGVLATSYEVALKTDLVSFFASMPIAPTQEAIQDHCSSSLVTKRLCDLIESFGSTPDRSGLVQRSTASAVVANMYLSSLDDVLLSVSAEVPWIASPSNLKYNSFARWMDDIWLFGDEPAAARKAQMAIQSQVQSLGLNLNFSKTDVLEGADVAEQALEIQHSAVDYAIAKRRDFRPLEELIERVLDEREHASHTSIKFAATRMRDNSSFTKAPDLLENAPRMPHAADALMRVFKQAFTHSSLQNWFLWYAGSDWATHEWSVAWYARMFPSSMRARKDLRSYFAESVQDANSSLPKLAICAQRLAEWSPSEAIAAISDAFKRSSTPQARRVLALAGLNAGESRSKVRKWLAADVENQTTLAMLEDWGWGGPKVQVDFAQ